jgi:hypothetical protein
LRGGDAASAELRSAAPRAESATTATGNEDVLEEPSGAGCPARARTRKPQASGEVRHSVGRDEPSVGHEEPQSPVREHIGAELEAANGIA